MRYFAQCDLAFGTDSCGWYDDRQFHNSDGERITVSGEGIFAEACGRDGNIGNDYSDA